MAPVIQVVLPVVPLAGLEPAPHAAEHVVLVGEFVAADPVDHHDLGHASSTTLGLGWGTPCPFVPYARTMATTARARTNNRMLMAPTY